VLSLAGTLTVLTFTCLPARKYFDSDSLRRDYVAALCAVIGASATSGVASGSPALTVPTWSGAG
jgi:hypothetical protein